MRWSQTWVEPRRNHPYYIIIHILNNTLHHGGRVTNPGDEGLASARLAALVHVGVPVRRVAHLHYHDL